MKKIAVFVAAMFLTVPAICSAADFGTALSIVDIQHSSRGGCGWDGQLLGGAPGF